MLERSPCSDNTFREGDGGGWDADSDCACESCLACDFFKTYLDKKWTIRGEGLKRSAQGPLG